MALCDYQDHEKIIETILIASIISIYKGELMKSRSRLLVLPILISLLLTPLNSIAQSGQQAQPFESFVTKIRDGLKLNEEQVGQLRQVLVKHEAKITELRRRAQAMPYAPGLLPEIEKEQSAIRDEIAAFLNDEQKAKLASVDARVPVPIAPPFVLINIPPRVRMDATGGLC